MKGSTIPQPSPPATKWQTASNDDVLTLKCGERLIFLNIRLTPIAWVSPAIIWFGIGETSKIFIIVYGTVFAVAVSTVAGVLSVHRDKIRAAQMFGATPWQIFRWVIAPSTVPYALTGMRIAMGISFMTVVAAEMLGAESGLGYLILSSRLWMATDKIFIGILVLGLLGFSVDRMFEILIKRFARHYEPS